MSNFSQMPPQPFGPPQPPGYHQPPPPPGFNIQYGAPQQPPYGYQPVPQHFGPPPPMQGFVPGYPGAPQPPGVPVQPVTWMQRPQSIPGVPPGLEYLSQIDNLQIEQKASLIEAVTGWDTNNKYIIMNGVGAQVYYACEETDTCMRICCSTRRAFKMHILDNFSNEVIRVTREFKCCAGCCWFAGCSDCCAYEVQVEAPVGNVIGYVKQSGSFFKPCYGILDENHQTILKLEGPFCILDGAFCPFDNNFKLKTLDGNEIGVLKKMYAGFVNEYATTADRFGINFPLDLSVKVKACLLGAMFLIDFMFFENPPNSN